MKVKEFWEEMDKIESSWPTRTDEVKTKARRDVLWERLEKYPVHILQAARNSLIDAGLEFMPSVPDILSACREAEELERPQAKVQRTHYKPFKHKCTTEKPCMTNALAELQMLFSYEAQHILCPGDIPATCPNCGKLHLEKDIFEGIIKIHPREESEQWNLCFKGLQLCENCAAR